MPGILAGIIELVTSVGAGVGGAVEAGAGALGSGLGSGLGTAGSALGLGGAEAGAIGAPLSLSAADYGGALGASALGGGGALEAGAIGGLGGDLAAGGLGGGGLLGASPVAGPLTGGAATTADLTGGATMGAPGGAGSAAGAAGPAGIDTAATIGPGAGAAPLGAPADLASAAAGAGKTGADAGLAGGISDFTSAHPYLTQMGLMGGGILAAPALSGLVNKVPQQGALSGIAGQAGQIAGQQEAYGTTLQQPLVTGQLPPGAQQEVTNALNDAISQTKSRYASLGLTGSTMEADAIANMQKQSQALTFQIAQQMAQTGGAAITQAANALGIQDQVYAQLMNAQVSQDNALQSAIARMASASALGSNPGAKAANALVG
jgi:hypothetical protein